MSQGSEVIEAQATHALAVVERPAAGLSLWEPDQLREQIARERALRQVMIEYVRSELREGVHFYTRKLFAGGGEDEGRGGQDKPSLTKEGALNICHLLHCRPGRPEVEREYHEAGHITVTTRVPILSLRTGEVVAEGEGCCSTLESKYAFRWMWPSKVASDDRAGRTTRRVKTRTGWETQYRFDNENVADQLNVVLKMSFKRALVAGVLQLPTVSEIFTQDLEDQASGDDDTGGGDAPAGEGGGQGEKRAGPGSRGMPTGERPPLDVSKLPRSEVRNRTSSRLHELAPGTAGKAERARLISWAFGDEVHGWPAVEDLPLSKLRVGLVKLLGYQPPTLDEADDVPLGPETDDVPLGPEAEAHLAALREEAAAAGEPAVLGPPTWEPAEDGYLTQAGVTQLRNWAVGLGLLAELEGCLTKLPGDKVRPLVTESTLASCISTVAFAYDAKSTRQASAGPAIDGDPYIYEGEAAAREPGADDA